MPPNPQTVVAIRMANATHQALAAYRRCLQTRVFPGVTAGPKKELIAAQRGLLESNSVELLTFPWRRSPFVTPDEIAAAGLATLPDTSGPLTRRGIGLALRDQFGDDDPEAYERRASRGVEAWLRYKLVVEKVHRRNLKEIVGTELLDELMRTYFVELARAASKKISVPTKLANPNE